MDKNTKAFTLVELLVSIIISVLLLGGVFYFMSDTILWIANASAHARFLKDFYGFTTILDAGNIEVIQNYPTASGSDVALLTDVDGKSGIIIGIVNFDTMKLASTGSFLQYQRNVIGYRSLGSAEITQVRANNNLVYSYDFLPDKVFSNFNIKNFQLSSFNSWSISEMMLSIFPSYSEDLAGSLWSELPQDDIFQYSLIF